MNGQHCLIRSSDHVRGISFPRTPCRLRINNSVITGPEAAYLLAKTTTEDKALGSSDIKFARQTATTTSDCHASRMTPTKIECA